MSTKPTIGKLLGPEEWAKAVSLATIAPRLNQNWKARVQGIRIPTNDPDEREKLAASLYKLQAENFDDFRYNAKEVELTVKRFLSNRYPSAQPYEIDLLFRFVDGRWYFNQLEKFSFSAFAINDFIHSSTTKTFGEHMAEHWDKIYAAHMALEWSFLKHSSDVLRTVRPDSIFEYRFTAPAPIREAQENLTRQEMLALVFEKAKTTAGYERKTAQKDIPRQIASLLLKTGSTPKIAKVTTNSIVARLARGFSNALFLNGDEKYDHLNLINSCNENLAFIAQRTFSTRPKSDDLIFADDLDKLATALLEHSENFTAAEYYFFVRALVEPNSVARAATRGQLVGFLIEALADEAVDSGQLMKLIGRTGAEFSGTLPTIQQWRGGLQSGIFALGMPLELALPMLGGKISGRQSMKLKYQKKLFSTAD